MGFHTPAFFVLAVVAFACFWLLRGRRLLVLAVCDCLFYLYAGLLDFGLFMGASIVSWWAGRGMRGRHKRAWVWFAVCLNLLNLAFFKYYYFVMGNLSKVTKVPGILSGLRVVLPIGISFYTFQLIAYLIDVYHDEIEPVQSFPEFWVFISFFGQVIAGPIMRAKDLVPQVARTESSHLDPERIRKGLLLFGMGLGKKLILADTLGPIADRYFAKGLAMSSVDVWLAVSLFAFQIYYDFSAYSDMALGIGHFFGYDLTRNFDTPYLSQNPVEFWKRWHVTLSSWIRDYVYIPMGGSRKGFARGIAVLVASMCISGLWHGASWKFVLWGLYHGLLSAAHRVWKNTAGRRVKPGALVRVGNIVGFFGLTLIGWLFFRVTDASQLWPLLARMLTFSRPGTGPHYVAYVVLIGGLYFLHVAESLLYRHFTMVWTWWEYRVPAPIRGVAYGCAVMMLWLFLRPKANAFIYFQF